VVAVVIISHYDIIPMSGSLPAGSPAETLTLPVNIRSQDGRAGGSGEVQYTQPSLGRRLRTAAALLFAGLVAAIVFLPIPLMHLVGIIVFLLMTGLAVRRLRSRNVLRSASGRCPACGAEGTYYVGFGGQRLVFPVVTSCPACHIRLELEPRSGAREPG
jgi:hypothetical protein